MPVAETPRPWLLSKRTKGRRKRMGTDPRTGSLLRVPTAVGKVKTHHPECVSPSGAPVHVLHRTANGNTVPIPTKAKVERIAAEILPRIRRGMLSSPPAPLPCLADTTLRETADTGPSARSATTSRPPRQLRSHGPSPRTRRRRRSVHAAGSPKVAETPLRHLLFCRPSGRNARRLQFGIRINSAA